MSRIASLFVALVLVAALPATGAAQEQEEKPLYERLGGVYPIAVVVDDFIGRLLVDSVINANPAVLQARDRVPAPGLKYHVTALVCSVTGGPCAYTGRGMKEAHAHLDITEREWQRMLTVFRATLTDHGVPAKEQEELVAIVESTKPEIVRAQS